VITHDLVKRRGISLGTGLLCVWLAVTVAATQSPPRASPFEWPAGKRAAISLSFDDARASQLDAGVPLFARHKAHVTFYLTAQNLEDRAADWRRAAGAGHEMANHSVTHPCSGNFAWSRGRALEDYTLDRMRAELVDANRAIEQATGVRPATFAYPCGQKFVGRGPQVRSYVPLVSELFLSGRGWLDEAPNDPAFVDLAQLTGYPMDAVAFEDLRPAIDDAIARGQWLVLAGHDIGSTPGPQVTRTSTLDSLLEYVNAPERGVWLDTVGAVSAHVKKVTGR
jgi:peptidoglycan/xylan/chitin deacetylase (PgdA/CDA1 family)